MPAITDEKLIIKMTFMFYETVDKSTHEKLRLELYRELRGIDQVERNINRKIISQWMAGSLEPKYNLYDFLLHVIEKRSDSIIPYDELSNEQKKVRNQVISFLRKRMWQIVREHESSGSHISRVSKDTASNIYLISISMKEHLVLLQKEIKDQKPNSDVGIENRNVILELIDILNSGFNQLSIEAEFFVNTETEIPEISENVLSTLSAELHSWVLKNRSSVVDTAMRLTPASGYIGLLNLAGANMIWATPIVLALCGGERITSVIKQIKASE